MNKTQQYVTLETLGNGAAAEMFAAELERAIANIHDPNTKAKVARGVTLKMKIVPNEKDRSFCMVEISCDAKLAPAQPFATNLFTGLESGKGVASEYNPQQNPLTVTNDDGEQVDVRTGAVVRAIK
jgi:hypothetical protein